MNNSIHELIETLGRLKAEIEWDYSLEYQVALEETIAILKECANGRSTEENR